VRNEAAHLPETLRALLAALAGSGFDAELVLVDDGSDDGSAAAAQGVVDGRLPFRVVRRNGEGRFAARRAGLDAATGELALLLDARVSLDADALRFLRARAAAGEEVWNAHVHVDDASAFGVFWKLLAELAWRDYFDAPRTTSFGLDEFDRFPKGTTCFFAPRELLLSAFDAFHTHYRDARLANDDTPILRDVAGRRRIGISPEFSCTYAPRTSLGRFLRHALHRGVVFVDGHGTPESRFFPAVVAFFPVSAALAAVALRRPLVVPLAAAAVGAAAAAAGARAGRSGRELRVLATVTPLYAAAHGAGMWRGAYELLRGAATR
jgi:glycosyltransferase involved in cell wall biosynthesis